MAGFSTAEQSLQLLRAQFVSQFLLGDSMSGLSMTDFLLDKKPARRSGTDIMNDALTGLMRSDTAMMRQASSNMQEGKNVYKLAENAVKSIQDNLQTMRQLAVDVRSGVIPPAEKPAARHTYMALADNIKNIIDETSYNGHSLTDLAAWQRDPAFMVDDKYGALRVQAGDSTTLLRLNDLSGLKDAFAQDDFNAGKIDAAIAKLDGFITELTGLDEQYGARAKAFDAESAHFTRQADIFKEATDRAQNKQMPAQQALWDILMQDQGNLLNAKS